MEGFHFSCPTAITPCLHEQTSFKSQMWFQGVWLVRVKKVQLCKYFHISSANNAKILWTASKLAVSLVQTFLFGGQKKGRLLWMNIHLVGPALLLRSNISFKKSAVFLLRQNLNVVPIFRMSRLLSGSDVKSHVGIVWTWIWRKTKLQS